MKTRTELIGRLHRQGLEALVEGQGSGWTITVPALGARILGAGVGEENAFWVAPSFRRAPFVNGGNAGGERNWIAPETGPLGYLMHGGIETWKVPSGLDPGDYRAVDGSASPWPGTRAWRNEFDLVGADGEGIRLAIIRASRIEACGEDGRGAEVLRVDLLRALENAGPAPLSARAALWDVVQVPCGGGGRILVPLRPGAGPSSIRPYYYDLPPGLLAWGEGLLSIGTRGGRAWKVGVEAGAAVGSIAFLRRSGIGEGYLFVSLRMEVDPEATYLDRCLWEGPAAPAKGDPLQAYGSPGSGAEAFAEIEAQAPAVHLAPGERQLVELGLTVARGDARALGAFIGDEFSLSPSELRFP